MLVYDVSDKKGFDSAWRVCCMMRWLVFEFRVLTNSCVLLFKMLATG